MECGKSASNLCLSQEQVKAADAIYDDFEIDGQVTHGTPFGAELPGSPLGWNTWYTGGFKSGEDLEYHEGADAGTFQAPAVPDGTWAFSTGIPRYVLYNDANWTYAGYIRLRSKGGARGVNTQC